jgi:MoaA/NifB/PqqE/SkfB family radical SAM enzyme
MSDRLMNVEINPGRMCNNKCIFCMSGYDRDEKDAWADPERMKAEIELRFRDGARSLGFLGGEPSAYPHILDCMAFAKRLGYIRIALCTNGTRLANPDFLAKALDAGLSRVTVSVHSHVPEIEEFLVGVPGILDKKVRAIRNLVEIRREGRLAHGVSLNPVLCGPNAPHMEAFVRFFAALGIDDVRFNYIWPEARVQNDKTVVPRFKDTVPGMLNLILKNERELKLRLSFGGVPFCVLPDLVWRRWPLLSKYFHEEGMDLPTQVSFLHPDNVGGVQRFNWHEKGRETFRGKVEACRGCPYDAACMGVYRSYLRLHGETEFGWGSKIPAAFE